MESWKVNSSQFWITSSKFYTLFLYFTLYLTPLKFEALEMYKLLWNQHDPPKNLKTAQIIVTFIEL